MWTFWYHLLFFVQDSWVLKLVSHGRNVNNFGFPCPEVFTLIVNCRLLPLCNICYEVADKGLMCGFVERWHRDTNTFHMSFGEMSITLDDESSLLHLPHKSHPVHKFANRMRSTHCPSGLQTTFSLDNRTGWCSVHTLQTGCHPHSSASG